MTGVKKTFSNDAPNGETDLYLKEEQQEINHIIDDATKLEDKEAVEHKIRTLPSLPRMVKRIVTKRGGKAKSQSYY